VEAGSPDFAVVGGGIVGCAAAVFLAEAGASVVLYERDEVGAAASGRNSGAVQHPFDPELTALHWETLEHYRRLASEVAGFRFPGEPAGLLMLAHDEADVAEPARALAQTVPELAPRLVGEYELRRLEPGLAEALAACRLETAYTIPPAAATAGLAELATRAGARIEVGVEARPWVEGGAVRGVVAAGRRVGAGAVLVAAGPWTPELLGGAAIPIAPVWGVNVQVALADPPRHVLEEVGVETADPGASAVRPGDGAADDVPSLFSLVTAGEASTLGSTFLDFEPDAAALADPLRERGCAYVPALREAHIEATRVCARPQSADGRPLVGAVPGVEGLFVCAGHGPWGISIGPASARLAADVMLGSDAEVPEALSPGRFAPR
jgi:glycine oxidase